MAAERDLDRLLAAASYGELAEKELAAVAAGAIYQLPWPVSLDQDPAPVAGPELCAGSGSASAAARSTWLTVACSPRI